MKTRELHRLAGITLLLPFIAWTVTAVFFLVRPAYEDAYAPLEVRQYPLEQLLTLRPAPEWQELRYFRSALGEHLLVRESGGWRHLDPHTQQDRNYPDDASLRRLVEDAISVNPGRYGELASVDGRRISTTNAVNITLDWSTLSLTQEGNDTRWINRLYSIHYLQWTGIAALDRVLGLAGLFLLMYMTWTGARLAFGRPRPARPARQGAAHALQGEEGR